MTLSAGLLMYRKSAQGVQVLLVHPGGPWWGKKDNGNWTIPKGEAKEGEALIEVAEREFQEETGFKPVGEFTFLTSVLRKDGKKEVHAWYFEGDCDPAQIKSNMIEIEWPPRSGKKIEIPEVDKGDFFTLEEAKIKINPYQLGIIEAFEKITPNI